jgi:hypothetical protein
MLAWRDTARRPERGPAGPLRADIGLVLLIAGFAAGFAQTVSSTGVDRLAQAQSILGAAEKAGKGWPYPEPAQRGTTGYSPNYSDYGRPSERWDIYVNIVWRKTASRAKADLEYYDYELGQFLDSMPDRERVRFKSAGQMLLVMEQIRGKAITLPYREATTSCLLFMVRHSGRNDLAADNCEARN